jgi:hypothetical protein
MIVSAPSRRPRSAEHLLGAALASRLNRLDIRSHRLFAGKLPGERRSKKRGASVEFAEHRQYAEGDDLRFIDWNVFARLDRLFVKLFMEEEDLALHLVVDASASMDTPAPPGEGEAASGGGGSVTDPLGLNKKLFACRLAAAMGYVGLSGQNRVGVTVFGTPGRERPATMADCRGVSNTQRMVRFLLDEAWGDDDSPAGGAAGAALAESNDLNGALHFVAKSRVGKGVVVVISDCLTALPPGAEKNGGGEQGFEPGLRSLSAVAGAGGFDVYCLQTLAPAEMDPELLGKSALDSLAGDLRLTDAESTRAAEVTITSALVREYKRRLGVYCDSLHSYCAARAISHHLTRTDVDIATMLVGTLRGMGMVA